MRRRPREVPLEAGPVPGGEAPRARGCDHPGCDAVGEFRAPKGPNRLRDYYWFCLDHVREYNRAWNYYKGMSHDEVERETRHDTCWQRPTWPMGWRVGGAKGHGPTGVDDPFGLFAKEARAEARAREDAARAPAPGDGDAAALAVLDLDPPVTLTEVKARYKELVKQLHPDLNGGDRAAEERLKTINHAYSVLRKSRAA